MKLGVVDVGGGLRGIYAAGVLDYCLAKGIFFSCCVGVSAGSANLTSYVSGQKGRNKRFYCEYAFRKEYMSLENFLRDGSYIDMEYVYGTLSRAGSESPLDFPALMNNPAQLVIVAENALTGEAKYFTKFDLLQDHYEPMMASCSIPGVNRPYLIDGIPYFDGALADPVPIQRAFDLGCDRVVLILTKPSDIPRKTGKDPYLAQLIQKQYPISAQRLRSRARRYNQSVALAKKYQAQGRACIIAPDQTEGIDTLSKNHAALERLYAKGLRDGGKITRFLAGLPL